MALVSCHTSCTSTRDTRRLSPEAQEDLRLRVVQALRGGMKKSTATRTELIDGVRSYLRSTQRQPAVAKSYFHAESVRYAAG